MAEYYRTSIQTTTTGLTDVEGARSVARRIFDNYDKKRQGQITKVDTIPMIVEAYKSFNQYFSPQNADIESYFKVLDRNQDGVITQDDIESLCIKYLCPQVVTTTSQQQVPQQVQRKEVVKRQVRRLYTQEVEQRLDVARRLFKQFDKDGSGQLDEEEIADLLIATYAQMGINNFKPTREDVKIWIEMGDTDNDGTISLDEYEAVVIRSLKKAGFDVQIVRESNANF